MAHSRNDEADAATYAERYAVSTLTRRVSSSAATARRMRRNGASAARLADADRTAEGYRRALEIKVAS
jgi:hypothetical protein